MPSVTQEKEATREGRLGREGVGGAEEERGRVRSSGKLTWQNLSGKDMHMREMGTGEEHVRGRGIDGTKTSGLKNRWKGKG